MDEEIWETLVRALRALDAKADPRVNRAEDWVQSQYGEWEDDDTRLRVEAGHPMDNWEVAIEDLRREFEDKIEDLKREVEELRDS